MKVGAPSPRTDAANAPPPAPPAVAHWSLPPSPSQAAGATELAYILNTHHHNDHVGANLALKGKHGCTIVGPKADRDRIPGIDVELADGDKYDVFGHEMECLDTPGHTLGHITLLFRNERAIFAGDTLFIMGCGRMFEGTPPVSPPRELDPASPGPASPDTPGPAAPGAPDRRPRRPAQMFWNSLSKFLALDPESRVYCAHEYTLSNAKFALSVDPDNAALQERAKRIAEMRDQGIPTVPGLLQDELQTNPFLRPSDPAIRAKVGVAPDCDNATAFGAIRKAKDNF